MQALDKELRHSREGGNPWPELEFYCNVAKYRGVGPWIPAFAGMTKLLYFKLLSFESQHDLDLDLIPKKIRS
jgi:hypothetical protein